MSKVFDKYTFRNGTVLKNKLVLAPMTTYSSDNDLQLSKEEEIYYGSRSRDFGMVITAACAINKNAQAFENQISIRDKRYLDSMTRLANSIKKEGAKAILQLHHGGRMNMPGLYPNQEILAPSAVKADRNYTEVPRELRTSEVYDIIDDFINAIKVAIKAGFDGVELHGANTYLLQQFVSPHSNRRNDEFGKDRLRFPLLLTKRAINTARLHAKTEFVIGYRFSPEELENPGITLDDTLHLVDELCNLDIDYLHVSSSNYKASSIRDKTNLKPIVESLHETIKDRVPLIGVGHIDKVEDAEDALSYGYDLVAVGLIALSDSFVVSKFEQGVLPSKVFKKDDLLPTIMYGKLKNWGLEKIGYSFE